MEWDSGYTQGTCVIWCDNKPFCHMITGLVGMRVPRIWGEVIKWRRQAKRWWPHNSCQDIIRYQQSKIWDAEWVLQEAGKLQGINNILWKREKGKFMQVGLNKTLTFTKGWRGQVVKFMHGKSGGEMDKGKKLSCRKGIIEKLKQSG